MIDSLADFYFRRYKDMWVIATKQITQYLLLYSKSWCKGMYSLVDFNVCPWNLKPAFIGDIINLGLSSLLKFVEI